MVEMIGGLGDLNKVMPEIMQMSKTTQTELVAIRELLEEIAALQRVQLTNAQFDRMRKWRNDREAI
jgi:hypothetical protein